MRVDILTVGDELLIGQVVNTNATWLGEQFSAMGARIGRIVSMADNHDSIQAELQRSVEVADVVVLSGGIGPTHDDVTRQALADFFGVELCFDASIYQRIEERYAARGQTPPESNRALAEIPEDFEVLNNPIGTAPGLWHTVTDGEETTVVIALPGVPGELKAIVQDYVVPRLKDEVSLSSSAQRTLLTAGLGESELQERLQSSKLLENDEVELAYLPSSKGVRLRLTAHASSAQEAREKLQALEEKIRERVSDYIYGMDNDMLEAIVGEMLFERGLTLAVAESCTGGLLADRITNVPGSSRYMKGGVVAYSNTLKEELLSVSVDDLRMQGAVSEVVVLQMAEGIRELAHTDVGMAITGIAGPKGGTPEKPVGSVWIGLATAEDARAETFVFTTDRLFNKDRSCTEALNMLRRFLQEESDVQDTAEVSIEAPKQ